MGLQEDINNIEERVERLVDEVEDEMDEFIKKDIVTPDWQEIQKKKVLYKGYRKVTRLNNELNQLLVKVEDVLIALRDLKTSLSTGKNMPPSLYKKTKRNLEKNIGRLKQYKEALQREKDSYDKTIRFFSSIQYILGSPRLSGMD